MSSHDVWQRPLGYESRWKRDGNAQRYTRLIPPGIGYMAIERRRAAKELGGHWYWEATVYSECFRIPLGTFADGPWSDQLARTKRWASGQLRELRDALAGRGDRCPF
jgi:hypothetical protein